MSAVPLPVQGSVAHPVWSPDGMRIAFELTSNGVESILDYNTQNHGLLTISNAVATSANPQDTVQTLDWSPDAYEPAITWSVGQAGHIHSLWLRHVGIGGTPTSQVIAAGNYVQAVYNRNGHGGAGSWLLITASIGQIANLWRVDVTPGALPLILTNGQQVNVAQWSPDGTRIEYLNAVSSGIGTLHVINTVAGTDTLLASGVAVEPLPAWSADGQSLVYNTGTQIVVVSIQAARKPFILKLQGPATSFIWSLTSPSQLVVAVSDGQQGIYLVDMQHSTLQQLDQHAMSGTILWTQVP
jgi:dipeptidyl aminopeptidase/acylaminoacyl peptidase